MDGAYATKAWRGLPDRVTVTTRMRANAAVFALAPPRTGKRGRPALKGARLASLAAARRDRRLRAGHDHRPRRAHPRRARLEHDLPVVRRRSTRGPVVVMLIRKPDRSEGFDVALASTDTDAPTAELIARYDSRWTIETAHQEAKAHGVGQARNRVQRAVERTVPFGFLVPDDHDRLVRPARRPRQPTSHARRRAAPVVPPEGHHQLRRHARRAAPRADPPRILGTSTRRDQHTTNHDRPVTVSARRRLRSRKSRALQKPGYQQPIHRPRSASVTQAR